MKKKLLTTSLSFLTICLLCACSKNGNGQIPDPAPDPEITERYTVTFKDGDQIVREYTNQKPGDYVDVPVMSKKDRLTNTGWIGMSEKEFNDKKVRVYEGNSTYSALWKEFFGTDTIYSSYGLKTTDTILVDGQKDSAYDEAEKIHIGSETVDASAEASVRWDQDNLYIFIEVTDSTYYPHKKSGQEINSCDSVALYLDILHDDKYAEVGYTSGWGVKYRGDTGIMCEGWFKISAGAQFTESERYNISKGSNFVRTQSLSSAARNSGKTLGTSIATAKGYNVEYRIDLTNTYISNDLKNEAKKQFGLGIVLFDQTNSDYDTSKACTNKCGLEELNLISEESPKKLSNFQCELHPVEQTNVLRSVKARDCFTVKEGTERDELFKDSVAKSEGKNKIECLEDEAKHHFYINKDKSSSNMQIKFEGLNDPINVNESMKISVDKDKSNYFTISYNNGSENISSKYFTKAQKNTNNFDDPRKLFTSKFTSSPMVVDGEKDASYKEETKIDINVQTLVEKAGLAATGVAYSAWDEEYIYLFVDVTDPNVDSTTVNTSNPELNDRVEFWISTCQSLPTEKTTWGPDNRPHYFYCGEGQFGVRAGMDTSVGVGGFHWMYDNKIDCPREISTKLTTKGYAVEMKIGWASFKTVEKENAIIDFSIYIDDGENNSRKGIVGTNTSSHLSYIKPYYLDHLKLEK